MNLVMLVRFSLILTFVVIILGAYTRLADAGLGCPDWPGCYGQLTVPTDAKELLQANQRYPELTVEPDKAWLEMIHRYFAGTLGLAIFAILAVCVMNRAQRPQTPLYLPLALCTIVVFQALLGMWTVTLKLMPIVVMGHLLGGFTLLCGLALLYWCLIKDEMPIDHLAIPPMLRPLAVVTLMVVIAQIALGGWTSSNYAALMCTALPICEGNWMTYLDFGTAFKLIQPGHDSYEFGVLDYGARMTIHVSHRIGAMVTALVALILVRQCFAQPIPELNRMGWRILVVLTLQILLGISNVAFSLPLAVAVAHNLVAALLLLSVLHVNFLLWHPNEAIELNKERIS
ncbi:COX15/CtaA family protein [Vibrio paucivorans]|uniref:COX15/CtaA family protein n=1 Tax=Vibrio paucivorans TaxID=2829489 RepID=A0A9X3CB28_9VIBR|nr:COX15/CtaA family protein [Vibrio paucivorans]MCW8332391.1 COX15/CtaA family protein [Vibrio paucivorans]